MTDNPDKDFEMAIEILDGKMDDTLTFYVSKKIKVGSGFFIGVGLFEIVGYFFEFGWLGCSSHFDVGNAIFGSAFVVVGITSYLEARQKVRESHLIRYARHLEKKLAED